LARRFIRDLKENREVFDIIDDVKDAGYGVAILSNTIWPHVNHHLESGHYKQFEKMNIFLSCEIGMVKEDPGTFSFVIDRLRAAPEECMFVDDVEDYLKVARGLGIGTALFNDAAQLRSDLASAGVDI
jgi:putative hydrolase of the HAD superfamily